MLRALTKTLRLEALTASTAILAAAALLVGCDDAGARSVRLGVYENAPKVYQSEDGRPAGLFIELFERVAAAEGWRMEPVYCNFSDCLEMLEHGDLDLMPDVGLIESRIPRFSFSARPVVYDWSQVAVRRDVTVASVRDLADLRVALLRGSVHQPALSERMAEAGLSYEAVPVDSLAAAYAAVAAGHADAAVANRFFAGWNNRRFGLVETPIVLRPAGSHFAAPKGANAELLGAIDRRLDDWRQDPDSYYYDALRRALAPSADTLVPKSVRYALLATGAAALLFAFIVLVLRWQVTARTRDLRTANQRLNDVLESGPCVLYALRRNDDNEVAIEWISANIARLYGFSPEEAMKPGWWARHVHPDDLAHARAMFQSLEHQPQVTYDYRIIDGGGRVRYVREETRRTGDDRQASYFGIWSDMTEAREHEAQMSFVTSHDLVTGLVNRAMLTDRIAHAIQRAGRQAGQIGMLFVDLDRFKHVNDSLGHAIGDRLLREVADRIGRLLSAGDTIARVGGDEFVLLLDDAGAEGITTLADEIVAAFRKPVMVGEHSLVVTASVGVALYPDDGKDADTLLKHAELAMYEAKRAGRDTCRRFAPELGEAVSQRLQLENALRQAIAHGELLLHYQPQYELAHGRLVGLEALVRWQHRERGLVPPALFIGIAEEIGIIEQIDAWVLGEACRQLAEWDRAGLHAPRVAVNLSALELESAGLVERVAATLSASGLAPARLELEVTETVIMRDPALAERALARLKALGVHLAVDDFGTGYSSLAYLKRLPLDRLKIDRSFVQDIGRSGNDESIVRAVIALAGGMGLETVAEGVEDTAHADFLRAEGCHIAQGYLYSRPLPAGELAGLLGGGARQAQGARALD